MNQPGPGSSAFQPGGPGHAEVAYLLGMCESRLGRIDAALSAWDRVPAESPLAASAALARGRALLDAQGRFIEAEAAYRAAMRGTGVRANDARWALAVLLLWEGRLDEIEKLLEEIGASAPGAIGSPRCESDGGSTRWSSRRKRFSRRLIGRRGTRPMMTGSGWRGPTWR